MHRNVFLAAGVLAIAACVTSSAQDLALTAGDGARVILENDKVRVIELTVAPGASTGMHAHGDHIIYFLAPGEALQKNPDGTEEKRSLPAGHIEWGNPVSHDTVNRGSVASRTLIIELK
jgi:quercetin dioxygenase-like cupin family protein